MNIGDYVRLNNCVYDIVAINRIAEIYEDTILTENDGSMYQGEYTKEEIIKSSPNIIDLIEVGDYVNGYEVTSKDQFLGFGNHDWYMINDEIKSIVTKEQFKSMEYKL